MITFLKFETLYVGKELRNVSVNEQPGFKIGSLLNFDSVINTNGSSSESIEISR